MSAFCAVCCSDIVGELLRRPLGKGDAMVNVCKGCDEEHPRQGRYSFDGPEVPARSTVMGNGNQWVSSSARRTRHHK